MTRTTHLIMAALVFGAGLTATGAAEAQTQTGSAAPPAAAAPAPAAPFTLRGMQYDPPAFKPWDPNASQPTYAVGPPPDTPSGIYLPAVVLGYAKSAAGCVVIGCEDGPTVGGAPGPASGQSSAPASSVADEPPANPWLSPPH